MAVSEANAIFEEVIKYVNYSNLNYQVNQTPYSVHISIRKKFLKGNVINNNFNPRPSFGNLETKPFENELNYIKSEYEKLWLPTESAAIGSTSHL